MNSTICVYMYIQRSKAGTQAKPKQHSAHARESTWEKKPDDHLNLTACDCKTHKQSLSRVYCLFL